MSDIRPLWEIQKDQAAADGIRLQKILAERGYGSRRGCEQMIEAGRVRVNGEVAVLGRRIHADVDHVSIDGVPVGTKQGLVYYLLNKPAGVVTTAIDTHGRPTVVQLVPNDVRVFPVGRLDVETEGLLLLTNDGELTHRLTHPSFGVEKEYLAEVEGELSNSDLHSLRSGIELEDGITAPAQASQPQPGMVRLVIHEGRNRQVRRMCDAIGHPVKRLVRVRIGPLRDTTLKPGTWRVLEGAEIMALSETVKAGKDAPPYDGATTLGDDHE
jgi:23S rRNA pseudouridine2605 synthase